MRPELLPGEPYMAYDCWMCGSDVQRLCWCHRGGNDGSPCRCPDEPPPWSPRDMEGNGD